ELQESIYPYRFERFLLRQDSAGPGKFRGGMGFCKQYRILNPCNLWVNFDRIECPPWGVQGGGAAMPGRVTILRAGTDEPEILYKAEGLPLHVDDRVIIETGGGGGYGPPAERALDLVARDLRRGYISPEAALADYGVRIAPD